MINKRRLTDEEIEEIFEGKFPDDELSKRILNKISAQRGIDYVKENRNFILLQCRVCRRDIVNRLLERGIG
jgi:hypothetical protein